MVEAWKTPINRKQLRLSRCKPLLLVLKLPPPDISNWLEGFTGLLLLAASDEARAAATREAGVAFIPRGGRLQRLYLLLENDVSTQRLHKNINITVMYLMFNLILKYRHATFLNFDL